MIDPRGQRSNMKESFSESTGAYAPIRSYVYDPKTEELAVLERNASSGEETTSGDRFRQSIRLTLKQVFLPFGYPKSVSEDYLTYQLWDTVQAFASSITGALATEAVMKGVGVGDETATPLAAALTWLIKSGSGHIGQIVFAWSKGTSLDYDCKKWRLFADGLNDIATFIDLIAPMFPARMVVFVLCSSSVARSLVGVAGSATRAAVTQHQARMNNMADVSAKDGSQETLVNLLALITSLILLPIVSGNAMAVWLLYFTFTFIHIFGNYKAVGTLALESFNVPRLLISLNEYLHSGNIPSVKVVNSRESVVLGHGYTDQNICGFSIKFGLSLETSLNKSTERKRAYFERLVLQSGSRPFLIIPDLERNHISVILHENILPVDILEAYIRSIFLGIIMHQGRVGNLKNSTSSQHLAPIARLSISSMGDYEKNLNVNPMDRLITKEWESFKHLAESQGFLFDRALIQTGDWRAKWLHS